MTITITITMMIAVLPPHLIKSLLREKEDGPVRTGSAIHRPINEVTNKNTVSGNADNCNDSTSLNDAGVAVGKLIVADLHDVEVLDIHLLPLKHFRRVALLDVGSAMTAMAMTTVVITARVITTRVGKKSAFFSKSKPITIPYSGLIRKDVMVLERKTMFKPTPTTFNLNPPSFYKILLSIEWLPYNGKNCINASISLMIAQTLLNLTNAPNLIRAKIGSVSHNAFVITTHFSYPPIKFSKT